MTTGIYNAKQKEVYFKEYANLSLLENSLKHLNKTDLTKFEISILGKVAQFYLDRDLKVSKDTDTLKIYWEKVLDNTIDFGILHNPELENIFIVGALASTFLYEVDGKALGMLSSGPYGILRGIGASEAQATSLIKTLNNGNFLLIFRGTETDLENYKRLLEEKKNGYKKLE
jgi:hypothetical protein